MRKSIDVCPRCRGSMRQGFVVDHTEGLGRVVSHWAAGAPVKSLWAGTKLPATTLIPIGTYRCSDCGYLESYARPEFAPQ